MNEESRKAFTEVFNKEVDFHLSELSKSGLHFNYRRSDYSTESFPLRCYVMILDDQNEETLVFNSDVLQNKNDLIINTDILNIDAHVLAEGTTFRTKMINNEFLEKFRSNLKDFLKESLPVCLDYLKSLYPKKHD